MKEAEEISFEETITGIIKNWKIIAICTLIMVIIAGIYAFFIADSKYQSKQEGIIAIPLSIETNFGLYEFPNLNKWDLLDKLVSEEVLLNVIEDYKLDITLQKFKDSISIHSEADRSSFTVKIISNTPKLAQTQLEALTKTFHETVVEEYKERARTFFLKNIGVKISNINAEILSEKTKLDTVKNQMSKTEKTIKVRKLILSDAAFAAQIANSRNVNIEDLQGEFMIEEVVNDKYYELEILLITQQQIVSGLETNLKTLNEQYNKLVEGKFDDGELDIMRLNIIFKGSPDLPESPVAPRKILILVIALIVGVLLGITISFGKFYLKD
jgi:capsular polysaccharide biosynthesis protein